MNFLLLWGETHAKIGALVWAFTYLFTRKETNITLKYMGTATWPFLGFSDMRHEVFLNSTGRHEVSLNLTGQHEIFLHSTLPFRFL